MSDPAQRTALRYARAMGPPRQVRSQPPRSAHRARGRHERELRIIAGRWRGRRWRFPPSALRPTPDRVRETLFNWLQDCTVGAHCLDLFAGSGALGLEALSRGAGSVIFVEQERAIAQALEQLLIDWQAVGAAVHCTTAQRFLTAGRGAAQRRYDLAFLDPPFLSGELPRIIALLDRGWLAPEARIYVEQARGATLPELPVGWRTLRSGTAGEVGYHLLSTGGGTMA